MECLHDLNDKNNTLTQIKNKREMVYPRQYRCICDVCKMDFSFIKVDGEFVEN